MCWEMLLTEQWANPEVSLNSNTPQTFEHRYSAKVNINLNNCHIVAFVYNDSGVLQVVQQAVSNE